MLVDARPSRRVRVWPRWSCGWVCAQSRTVSASAVRPVAAQGWTWWGMRGWPGPRGQPAPWHLPPVSCCQAAVSILLSGSTVCMAVRAVNSSSPQVRSSSPRSNQPDPLLVRVRVSWACSAARAARCSSWTGSSASTSSPSAAGSWERRRPAGAACGCRRRPVGAAAPRPTPCVPPTARWCRPAPGPGGVRPGPPRPARRSRCAGRRRRPRAGPPRPPRRRRPLGAAGRLSRGGDVVAVEHRC